MAKTKGNTSNATGSGQANQQNLANNSWADRVEEFSSNLQTSATQLSSQNPTERFFVITLKEGSFQQVSPFLIQKALHSIVGNIKTVKKLRSDELLVEVSTSQQAKAIMKCKTFAHLPVSMSAHRTLNYSRGVISEPDLTYTPEAEILDNLQTQSVCDIRRITIRKEGKIVPTKHIILTFKTPNIPNHIIAGYLRCNVRKYVPNPLRCFQCQRFGHSKQSCRGSVTCARCAEVGHDSENCEKEATCVNCKGQHPSYARSCPTWQREREVQALKTERGISYPEAKKIVNSRTPTIGISYASAISKKSVKSTSTQTDLQITSVQKPKISKSNAVKSSTSPTNNKNIANSQTANPKTSSNKSSRKTSSTQSVTGIPSTSAKIQTPQTPANTKSLSRHAIELPLIKSEEPCLKINATDSELSDEDSMSTISDPKKSHFDTTTSLLQKSPVPTPIYVSQDSPPRNSKKSRRTSAETSISNKVKASACLGTSFMRTKPRKKNTKQYLQYAEETVVFDIPYNQDMEDDSTVYETSIPTE